VLKHLEVSTTKESYFWIGLNLIDFVLTSIRLIFEAIEVNLVMRYFGINAVWEFVPPAIYGDVYLLGGYGTKCHRDSSLRWSGYSLHRG
jgi:hypothetical protein